MIKKIFSKIIYLPFIFPPIYLIKFPIKNLGTINLLDLVLLLSIILGLLLIFQKKDWDNFKKYLIRHSYFRIVLWFWLFGIISIIFNWSNTWIKNLSLLKSFFILPTLFVLIVSYFFKKDKKRFYLFFKCYFGYSIFLSILTIFSWLIKETTFDNRVKLFFESPNQLAIALSLGIISGIIIQIKKKIKINLFLLLGLALLLTKSAGAILAISIVIFIAYNNKLKHKLDFFVKKTISFSLLIILIIFLLAPILNKINYDPFLNQNSLDSRLVIYLSSNKIISDNFINGIAPSNFQKKYLEKQKLFSPYPQWAVPHSHNLFTQIWLSFGLFGLILWIYLLYKKMTSPKNLLGEASFYFILYFLVHGLVDVPIWNNDQALFFWFILFL